MKAVFGANKRLCDHIKEKRVRGSAYALLVALEGMVDAYASISIMFDFDPKNNPKYNNAIAAIKQARGEQ